MRRDESKGAYVLAIALHLFGSLLAAAAVGGLLGLAAKVILPPQPLAHVWLILATAALVLLVREMGWIRFPIPQVRRQTRGSWRRSYGVLGASFMWGLDLGPGLWTFVAFSGYWLIVLGVLLAPTDAASAVTLVAYGAGRAVAVAVPGLVSRSMPLVPVLQSVDAHSLGLPQAHRLLLAATVIGAGFGAAL